MLKKWDQDNWASLEQCQKLLYITLVKLLAYQFVPPVRWIEIQDLLFKHLSIRKVCPSPTLTGMPRGLSRPGTKLMAKLRTTLLRTPALFSATRGTGRRFTRILGTYWHVEAEPIPDAVPAIFSATCANYSSFRGEPFCDSQPGKTQTISFLASNKAQTFVKQKRPLITNSWRS